MKKDYAPSALYFENLESIERMKSKNFTMEYHEYVRATWRRRMIVDEKGTYHNPSIFRDTLAAPSVQKIEPPLEVFFLPSFVALIHIYIFFTIILNYDPCQGAPSQTMGNQEAPKCLSRFESWQFRLTIKANAKVWCKKSGSHLSSFALRYEQNQTCIYILSQNTRNLSQAAFAAWLMHSSFLVSSQRYILNEQIWK